MDFIHQPTTKIAKDLLGMVLCRQIDDVIYRGVITETEAYLGKKDTGCHSAKKRTPRTEPMYDVGGTLYVYLIYGMYCCLNIVTQGVDVPEAVLIRSIKLISPNSLLIDGPGKLCRELKIDRSLSGQSLGQIAGIWLEPKQLNSKIVASLRVGLNTTEPWQSKKLNFKINV